MRPRCHSIPLLPLLLQLFLLFTAFLHPAIANDLTSAPIDLSTTPGFASLDTCTQLCFTGQTRHEHGFGARLGCATKACVCDPEVAAVVKEYMELCERMSCASPRRFEWWKRGAWKEVFERFCEGVWGEAGDDGEGWQVVAEEGEVVGEGGGRGQMVESGGSGMGGVEGR